MRDGEAVAAASPARCANWCHTSGSVVTTTTRAPRASARNTNSCPVLDLSDQADPGGLGPEEAHRDRAAGTGPYPRSGRWGDRRYEVAQRRAGDEVGADPQAHQPGAPGTWRRATAVLRDGGPPAPSGAVSCHLSPLVPGGAAAAAAAAAGVTATAAAAVLAAAPAAWAVAVAGPAARAGGGRLR